MSQAKKKEEEKKEFGEKMKAARAAKAAERKAQEEAEKMKEEVTVCEDESDTDGAQSVAEPEQIAPVPEEQLKEPSQAKLAPKTYTEDEVKALVESSVEAAVMKLAQQQAAMQPTVVHVSADTEKVVLLFMAEVSQDNVVNFGPGGSYGHITGPVGTVMVPKSEWSRFMTRAARSMIDRRVLMIVSGLSDEERELYNAVYKEGELLDRKMFTNILNLGKKLLEIFPQLCREHQLAVSRRFLQAYENNDPRAKDRELIVELNRMSHDDLFLPIIKGLNAADLR